MNMIKEDLDLFAGALEGARLIEGLGVPPAVPDESGRKKKFCGEIIFTE